MSSGITFSLFTIGCIMTLIAFIFIEDVKSIFLVLFAASFIWLFIFWKIVESPYFLFNKNKLAETKSAFLQIGNINEPSQTLFLNTKLDEIFEKLQKNKELEISKEISWEEKKVIYFRISMACILFLNVCVGYYLSALVTQRISNFSIYINGILMEFSEFVAYFSVVLLANKLKRRNMNLRVALGLFCGSIILLTFELIPFFKTFYFTNLLNTSLSVFIKFIIGMNFALLYNYTAELLPTAYRGRGLGMVGIFNKMGGVFASIFEDWSKSLDVHPMIFSGTFSVFAFAAAWVLPETLNKSLTQ